MTPRKFGHGRTVPWLALGLLACVADPNDTGVPPGTSQGGAAGSSKAGASGAAGSSKAGASGPAGTNGGAGSGGNGAGNSGSAGTTAGSAGAGASGTAGRGGATTGGTGGAAGSSTAGKGGSVGSGGAAGSATAGRGGSGGSAGTAGGSAGGSAGTAGAPGTGGAAGSAGTGTAGTPGTATGGASRCTDAGVLFCEGFENGLDTAAWTSEEAGDAKARVDQMHAARGSSALHVSTTAGSGHAFVTTKRGLPVAGNVLFGRMFVWFGDDITSGGHFTLAEAAGSDNSAVVRFGGQYGFWGVGTDHGTSGDWTDKDDVPLAKGRWYCIEFEFKGDSNEFRVWQDDAPKSKLSTGVAQHPNFKMPTMSSLWFGWWNYNAQEPQDLWIDEIALDSKPIGCSK